jgi:dienelactone hydrolase
MTTQPPTTKHGFLLLLALSLFCPLFAIGAPAQQPTAPSQPTYSTIYYKNGDLNLEAYIYKPAGKGPFPLVIYNHGSRVGNERKELPFSYVGEMLLAHGYAVLVPERRGYGKSDGKTWSEDVGADKGQIFVRRLQDETGDVLAALDYIKTLRFVDSRRIALMGWSLGGMVSVFAASRNSSFKALINQAGGSLAWNGNAELRQVLPLSARKVKVPSLCMVAENDATTEAVVTVGDAIRAAGTTEKTIIYPAFTPTNPPTGIAPGHVIFSAQGIQIWQNDLLSFLHTYMSPPTRRTIHHPK